MSSARWSIAFRSKHRSGAPACISLAWFAIRLWGLCPDRHSIPDYREEIEQYIAGKCRAASNERLRFGLVDRYRRLAINLLHSL
jgi:hypothetical protein